MGETWQRYRSYIPEKMGDVRLAIIKHPEGWAVVDCEAAAHGHNAVLEMFLTFDAAATFVEDMSQ